MTFSARSAQSIQSIQSCFGSRSKAQEIVFLLHNAKDVVRQGFYLSELPPVEEFCKKECIFLVKSAFTVLLEEGALPGAFTNKGVRVPSDHSQRNHPQGNHSQGMFFIYLSKNEKKAYEAAYAEQLDNHEALGKLLGYPSCCISYFCQHFSENNPNPEIFSQQLFTNISKRDEDLAVISHFPCREDCRESILIGQKYFKKLQDHWPERAEELRQGLARPFVLSSTGKKGHPSSLHS